MAQQRTDHMTGTRASAGAGGGGGLAAPLLWGSLFTITFYTVIPYVPWQRELLERYFCSHPLEYLTAGLFFIGLSLLLFKARGLRLENRAFDEDLSLPGDAAPTAISEATAAVTDRLQSLGSGLERTVLVQRLRELCSYVRGKQSAEGLDEHARYLADLAVEQQGRSYALVRTITWAVPILGFLGTVMGITIAIANVTPDQLDSSLSSVTAGLAVAFDTTALALALSLVLVFSTFLVERSEQKLLARVEEFVIEHASSLFPHAPGGERLPGAEATAAELILKRTHELIARQTKLWEDSLETLRSQWTGTLARQQQELDAVLRHGMSATLDEHRGGLEQFRQEFVSAYGTVSSQLADTLQTWQRRQDEQHEMDRTRADQLWDEVRSHTGGLVERIENATDRAAAVLSAAADSASQEHAELSRQREVLEQVISQEAELARLQAVLAENLKALQQTDTFEQTMHSLSAAVHVLTANLRHRAA